MSRNYLKTFPFLLAVGALLSGRMTASQIPRPPRADYSVDLERRYALPFDAAWERVLSFGRQEGMKIIASDKASGIVTFAKPVDGAKLYYNMLVREGTTANETVVYVFQRRSQGGAGKAYDSAILSRLSAAFSK